LSLLVFLVEHVERQHVRHLHIYECLHTAITSGFSGQERICLMCNCLCVMYRLHTFLLGTNSRQQLVSSIHVVTVFSHSVIDCVTIRQHSLPGLGYSYFANHLYGFMQVFVFVYFYSYMKFCIFVLTCRVTFIISHIYKLTN